MARRPSVTGLRAGPDLARARRSPTIDIGSNSVRLVVYEGLTRSPTPIFNEKAMCGLGRAVATTGPPRRRRVAKALAALRRFRTLCDTMDVEQVHVLATAAVRDAEDGGDFIARGADDLRAPRSSVLSGKREAKLSALGVVSGFHKPDGIVGDWAAARSS